MAKKGRDAEADRVRFLKKPLLTIASDAAIAAEELGADLFDLGASMGPVYDILRHPSTRTPLTVAVYGDWGSGKTSAMRWLQGRLDEWTRSLPLDKAVAGDRQVPVQTIWFHPWKYHQREDVWKGLIAEVILAFLRRPPGVLEEFLGPATQVLRLMGRGASAVVSALELSIGDAGTKLNFKGKGFLEALREAVDGAPPEEAAFLNAFEDAFRGWVGKALEAEDKAPPAKDGLDRARLVVFIDDLDRCLPEVALEVLEALKLYLDIPGLAFVAGVDDKVVNAMLVKRHGDQGVDANKARQYLAKMFQVEIHMAPPETEVRGFMDGLVEANETWGSLAEGEENAEAMAVFQNAIFQMAGRSPREVKRLLNSALIRGMGATMSEHHGTEEEITPQQGIQAYLIRKRLAERPEYRELVGSEDGDAFLAEWSRLAKEYPTEFETGKRTLLEKLRQGPDGKGGIHGEAK